MATEILLPKLGFSMDEGILSEWLVPDGGQAVAGEPLYSVESDKSVTEIEAPVSGVLTIQAAAGETYGVGTVLGSIA